MLETIWFVLWGVLWAVYFMLDGFDLGLGSLMPFVARNDQERRIVMNAMGPFWDGNEVWLITAGGVTFAAFPKTYAIMFSALYAPMMLLLFGLILRGISFEFRSKLPNPLWRKTWDACLFLGSITPSLLLGITFANLFMGIPITEEGIMQGGFFDLLNPYALLGGAVFVFLFFLHGGLWLAIKTDGELHARGVHTAKTVWPIALLGVLSLVFVSAYRTDLFKNYLEYPVLFLIPLLAVVGFVLSYIFLKKALHWQAWGANCLTIVATTFFGIAGMYPNMLISSLNPLYNVTAFNAASSPLTLKIMLGIALFMIPIVILYQTWVYRKFSAKVKIEDLVDGESY